MMKAQHGVLALVMACLAACSQGPSTADAKAVVLSKINGGCGRLEIEDFENVNGVADGDANYLVSVKYTLEVKPPQGNDITQDAFDTRMKDLIQQHRKALQVVSDLTQQEPAIQAASPDHQTLPDAFSAQERAAQDAEQQLVRAEMALQAQPAGDFDAACSVIDKGIAGLIRNGLYSYQQQNPDKNGYLNGFSLEVTDALHLIKTDNGWKENL